MRRPELLLDKKGNYFLSIDFEETPSTTFDGIVGYIPPPRLIRQRAAILRDW
ncbi:MAG: hypothetical protein R3C26_23405 [Calditrichia bacterium]